MYLGNAGMSCKGDYLLEAEHSKQFYPATGALNLFLIPKGSASISAGAGAGE
jgi:hypothetical protein